MADGNSKSERAAVLRGSEHDLWLHGGKVLSITLDKDSKEFPPVVQDCTHLNQTIQGLARAAKSVVYHAGAEGNAEFLMQPLEDIADAIVLLSQLSDAVLHEVTRTGESEE